MNMSMWLVFIGIVGLIGYGSVKLSKKVISCFHTGIMSYGSSFPYVAATTYTFQALDHDLVECRVRNGSVRVVVHDEPFYKIEEIIRKNQKDGQCERLVEKQGNTVRIVVHTDGNQLCTDYTVYIPKAVTLDSCHLELANGQIEVQSVVTKLQVRLNHGQVNLQEVSGTISCRVDAGQVIAQLLDQQTSVSAKVNAGTIELTVPGGVAVSCTAHTTVGTIEAPWQVSCIEYTGARCQHLIPDAPVQIDCHVDTGTITIKEK